MAKKSISNAHFLVFLSRQCQNVGNVHETFINTKIPFKRRTFLDQKVPHVSSETSLPRLVQNKPRALIPAKKTRLNSSKHNFMVKSSRLSTKKNLDIFLNFFFPFVSFIGVFSNLKRETLVLKTTTWWTRANHFFCWRMTSTKVPNPLLSHPLCGWPFDFSWGGAYGWFSLGKNVSPKPLELEIFSQAYNGVRFVSALYTSCAIFFSVQIIIFPGLPLRAFAPQNQLLSR